ncbi:MAG: ATP-binding cassette domain-containing protein [Azospirillum sp.]|nr:ATP-binding cassette domain-containing protein [Azospirillum sp.]
MNDGALCLRGVTAGYRSRPVLRALDLPALTPGQVAAVLGPNGAGKTTLLRAIAGLLPATGSCRLGERDLFRLGHAARAACVAYMPQTLPAGVALTVLEAVMTALRAAPVGPDPDEGVRGRALDTLERLGLDALAMTPLGHLSGGQRQLASLAQALVRRPPLLLLDEPTSALDLMHQVVVMQQVRAFAADSGAVVLMVLHDLGLAMRWSDRIVLLSRGEVAAVGPPVEAITADRLAAVYGVRGRVEPCSQGFAQVIADGVVPSAAALSARSTQ